MDDITIRKSQKRDFDKMARKMAMLADQWNIGNDYDAYEAKIIDVTRLIK